MSLGGGESARERESEQQDKIIYGGGRKSVSKLVVADCRMLLLLSVERGRRAL